MTNYLLFMSQIEHIVYIENTNTESNTAMIIVNDTNWAEITLLR